VSAKRNGAPFRIQPGGNAARCQMGHRAGLHLSEPVSRSMGARRFTFRLSGQLTLLQRCTSDKGRHWFMMGQPTSSGNVFLDCSATVPYSSSEPHEQWGTGGLYDNVHAPLTARFWKNISIGWAGANTVFWNCEDPFSSRSLPLPRTFHSGISALTQSRLTPRSRTSRKRTGTSNRGTNTLLLGVSI
jgi:hypothetical protein